MYYYAVYNDHGELFYFGVNSLDAVAAMEKDPHSHMMRDESPETLTHRLEALGVMFEEEADVEVAALLDEVLETVEDVASYAMDRVGLTKADVDAFFKKVQDRGVLAAKDTKHLGEKGVGVVADLLQKGADFLRKLDKK